MEENSQGPAHQAQPFFERRLAPTALVMAIALGAILCAFMAGPCLGALVWSTTLGVLCAPFNTVVGQRLNSRGLSALITVIVVACIVVVPAILMAGTLLNEAVRSAALVAPMFDAEGWARVLGEQRSLAPALQWIHDKIDLPDLIRTASSAFATWSGSVLRASFSGVANLLLTFYFLFYLLRDRERIAEVARLYLPLSPPELARITRVASDTIFATVFGTVTVAALRYSGPK